MRNIILTITLAFLGLGAIAQTGIGTPTPNPSAQLHIEASNKGILIPQVALKSLNDITSIDGGNVNSLLVFNPTNANGIAPGYYYWLDTEWKRLMPKGDIYANVKYDGNDFYYTNETGVEVKINLEELIQGSETNTFIKKVNAEVESDGTVTSPTVYYYFSEQAIKDWLEADEANTIANMPVTAPGVIVIELADDVAINFEHILNQTITYEGEQITIEEIIKNISQESEGNVIYVNDKDSNDPNAVDNWVFKYFDGTEYKTINLNEWVNELETNTFIRKVDAVIDNNGTVSSPTVYYYFSEQAIKDWLEADAANTIANMPVTAPGVIVIELADDVAINFEHILKQTITYEGEQITIEEIIKNISQESEGNVIYVNDKDPNDPNAVDNWVFKYFDGTNYVTIDLGDFVVKNQLTYEVKGGDDVNVTNVLDENHTTYTVEVKAAMPKFFYMPTILFDTSTIENGKVKDLHEEYRSQFTNVVVKNASAPADIPHLPLADDLHYYITDYDDTVISNILITDDGKMTYDVINNAGPYSYITVIFVVK